jgi:hypothetical protein
VNFQENLVKKFFGKILVKSERSLFMGRGVVNGEGGSKRSFILINRGVKKVLT